MTERQNNLRRKEKRGEIEWSESSVETVGFVCKKGENGKGEESKGKKRGGTMRDN